MGKIQDLEKAERERNEVAQNIDRIKFHLRTLESDLALLRSLKVRYEENISILKDSRHIAGMSEYKKVKAEFSTILSSLKTLHTDFKNHEIVLARLEKMLFAANAKYATLLSNQNAKVIIGTFGKKRNAKKDP